MIDDLIIIEDLDVGDEAEVRKIVSETESLVSVPSFYLRISFLTTEQWQTVQNRVIPSSMRHGAALYINVIKDPEDPAHLLVSPSLTRGINENSKSMYQELVYTVLRALPSKLPGPLRKGVDDILAETLSERLGVEFYTRNAPRESRLVKRLMTVLQKSHGYNVLDWTVVFRRNPDRIFKALEKNQAIGKVIVDLVRQDSIDWNNPEIQRLIGGGK